MIGARGPSRRLACVRSIRRGRARAASRASVCAAARALALSRSPLVRLHEGNASRSTARHFLVMFKDARAPPPPNSAALADKLPSADQRRHIHYSNAPQDCERAFCIRFPSTKRSRRSRCDCDNGSRHESRPCRNWSNWTSRCVTCGSTPNNEDARRRRATSHANGPRGDWVAFLLFSTTTRMAPAQVWRASVI